jgi:hypothetical protein
LFESVRGVGLMLGVKMKTDSRAFVNYLREQGLLTVAAGDNVMRVLPPLIIEEAHIREFVERCRRRRGNMRCRPHEPEGPRRNLNLSRAFATSRDDLLSQSIEARCRPISTRRSASPSPAATRAGGSCGSGRCSTTSFRPTIIRRRSPASSPRLWSSPPCSARCSRRKRASSPSRRRPRAGSSTCWSAIIKAGELRGYVRFDRRGLGDLSSHRDLAALFGKGYLAITFDHPLADERYQGIVPLEGSSLGEAAQSYFVQSEQIAERGPAGGERHRPWSPAACSSSICRKARRGATGCTPGSTIPTGSTSGPRRDDQGRRADRSALPLESALWRLFHEEEVRVLDGVPLSKGCRCNFDYIKGVIGRFGADERAHMVDEDGFISVDCEFCSRVFPISLSDFDG